MLSRIRLNRFTAFEALELEASPGINVLIGENGTGKTHLLQLAGTCCRNYSKSSKARSSCATRSSS